MSAPIVIPEIDDIWEDFAQGILDDEADDLLFGDYSEAWKLQKRKQPAP